MSILSCNVLRNLKGIVDPFQERTVVRGRSCGLSIAGYDIQVAERHLFHEAGRFQLGSSAERFKMPKAVIAFVKDKSSWARQGLSVFNTVIEPGWEGFLTLELMYHGDGDLLVEQGDPIAQVIFQWVDNPGEGYAGKYQNQEAGPQPARWEQIGEAQKISE